MAEEPNEAPGIDEGVVDSSSAAYPSSPSIGRDAARPEQAPAGALSESTLAIAAPVEFPSEGGGPEDASRPAPPPAPGAMPGTSQLPPAPVETLEAIAAAVGRLRAEVDATRAPARKARLLNEVGEIEEIAGDEAGAARDYLAAYNADTSFREPLEALVRLLERRRSLANLGKLVEALVAAASSPEERARALTERAVFLEDIQRDLEGARGAAREAAETDASASDRGAAWLTLERVAAKLSDLAEREEALAGRAELTADPTWRGLLLVDAATLAATSGDVERALALAVQARDEAAGATWTANLCIERLTRAEPGLGDSEEAVGRATLRADALARGGELVREAMVDAARGDALGVPRHARSLDRAVDGLLRAADGHRTAGAPAAAASALDRAMELLLEARGPGGGVTEELAAVERVLLNARLRLAEATGDTALAADLAARRLEGEVDGGTIASLAMRVAEHAASEGRLDQALAALADATRADPLSAPARALELDILDAQPDGARFAAVLEELSRHLATGEAQGRTLLLASYVWAARANDLSRAREALGQAEACGVGKEVVARLGRSLASLGGDDDWYEAATRSLIEERPAGELPLLWVELARLRLLQGDGAGAARATAQLSSLEDGAWLGRVLDAFAATTPEGAPSDRSTDGQRQRARAALDELASGASDPDLRRSLTVATALRAHAAGDGAAAVAQLRALAEGDPRDPLVAAYLGDLLRAQGDRGGAAEVARTLAEARDDDPPLRCARLLEAGFEAWSLGDRGGALVTFEAASEASPEGAEVVAAWAARGVDVESLFGRRRALALASPDASVALERFALEATVGDPDEAASALRAVVDSGASEGLTLAAALARLVWPRGADEADALQDALARLSASGGGLRTAAAAERLRVAREESLAEPAALATAAQEWLEAGGGAPAAVEWLAAAMAGGNVLEEVPARRALADLLTDEPREAMLASAALLEARLNPERELELLPGSSQAIRLANLELAPPGCEPLRRAAALSELDGALGPLGEVDGLALAGWSTLAAGDAAAALATFRAVTAARSDDLQSWEGLRAAAERLGDLEAYALACEALGARSANAARGAAFWEQAALSWSRLGAAFDARVDVALDASFTRDPSRASAFDRLFRRVRERKEGDRLLHLVTRRLEVSEDAQEIAKLYWEMARVLREKGDPEGALEALEHVTTFDENHVGALALTGEIFIRRGMFAEAADKLAHLATIEVAPPKNRITAGVAAVDLYENKLGRNDRALEVLLALHAAKLTTLPVRERLARAAARAGAWAEATAILEELMHERPERDGRIEAARLAVAIHRDRRSAPAGALAAVTKLLDEAPSDGEALDVALSLDPSTPGQRGLLERGRDALLLSLHEAPASVDNQRRLARISRALGDGSLEQSALSCAVALGGPDGATEQRILLLASKKPRVPQVALTEAMIRHILVPGDDGPVADLFVALGLTLAEALGPQLSALGVHPKKDRVDPRAGLAVRNEIATWAGAFGIANFDLYVGGKDPNGVQGVAGEVPALVVGAGVNAPLSPTVRGRVARELFAIIRGTTVTRWRDDTTIAAIVVGACNLSKVPVAHPPFAVLAEVERLLGGALSRKARAAILPICKAFVQSGQDARQWAGRARASQGRVAVLASGDVSVALADIFGEPLDRLGGVARDDLRAHELLRFVLSRPFFDLRRALGLEL